jgi:Double zinc ribbon
MNAQAGARQCPRCNAPSAQQARFCNSCGAFLHYPASAKCCQMLPEGARFCTACGAPTSSAGNAATDTAVASTIAGLELALYQRLGTIS